MRRTGLSRPAVVLALIGLVLTTALATLSFVATRPPTPAPAVDVLASLPLTFEPAGDAGFVSRGPGYSLALSPSEAVLGVPGGRFGLRPAGPTANPSAALVAGEPLGAKVSRFGGDDPSRWATDVPTYGRVEARQVWPGVDVVWHGDQRRLQHDMVVAPGVDPAVVALDVEGAQSLSLHPDGDLVVDLDGAEARLARPFLYQDTAGGRKRVNGGFALLGPSRIGFRVGDYDRSRPLVIDPTLVTSTLLGGSGADSGYAVAVDGQGNTYVTGTTESADFPSVIPVQRSLANAAAGPTTDVFVSKLSADGSRLVWSTYLGGGGRDTGYAIAVTADESVYVTGVTESSDFPRARAAQENYGGGPSDAFAARISPNGTALEWSTFVGGSQTDRGRGLALDGAGNAFLTGSTSSVDFPAVSAFQPGPYRPDDVDAFLVKVPSGGGPLSYATRVGGGNDDRGLAVAADSQGNAYVTGDTLSPLFPTVRAFQSTSGGSAGGVAGSFPDAFVTKFDPTGAALVYSTFLGGADVDQGTAIAVDAQGAVYVAGNTNSANFPLAAPLQAQKAGDVDAFVAKIDAAGAALVYSTYVGGGGADGANAVAVDRGGNAHVAGTTGSANWPTNRPVQPARGGGEDAFLLRLDTAGRSTFSTYVGGRDADAGTGVAVDAQGGVRMFGLTASADFPSVKPVQGSRPAAAGDAFVATLDLADVAPPPPAQTPAPAATSSSDDAHDRRVQILGGLTVALLLAAVAQTVYLRRRPAPAPAPGRPPSRPTPKPTAAPGLKVLGDSATATPGKAGAASKSTRTPKVRGGPKGAKPKTPAAADVGDGGPPTVATPAPPRQAKPKRQEPAIAQLLEEDLWAPEPAVADRREVPEPPTPVEEPVAAEPAAAEAVAAEPAAAQAVAAEEAATQEAAAEEAAAPPTAPPPTPPGPEPAPAIPPVPAAELSFWDLFPEDLPPARTTNVPVEDVLVEHLALPEGPDSNAGRLIAPLPDEPDRPEGHPPPPPEAEIVIAELLDGPPPTGPSRPPPESPWPPQPEADLVISELLDEPELDEDDAEQDAPPPVAGRSREEQARIAADRARRRRARRGGRRKSPGSG